MRGNFNEGKRFGRVFGTSAGSTGTNADLNGSHVDMQGFRSLSAVLAVGTLGSAVKLRWEHSDTTTDGDFETVAGSVVDLAADDDNEIVIMSYERVEKRYVRLVFDRDGSNTSHIAGAVYISHLARDTDIAQPTGVHSVNQVNG